MTKEPDDPRAWLVTGVRHRDVKGCYEAYLAQLKPGTVMDVYALLRVEGRFMNLRVSDTWQGRLLNVGVISTKHRDAATYMDDDGRMQVRVLEGCIGDIDFWVEPVLEAPLRAVEPRPKLSPPPFAGSVVPFHTEGDIRRTSLSGQLKTQVGEVERNIGVWSMAETRLHVKGLVEALDAYFPHCLQSLSTNEHQALNDLIGHLGSVIELLGQTPGLADCALMLEPGCETLKDLEREYSKEEVCARIYCMELAEVEASGLDQFGWRKQYFVTVVGENLDAGVTRQALEKSLADIDDWLKGFLNGYYLRMKHDVVKLAHVIMCEQLTRPELYSYYCCEILARCLRAVLNGECSLTDMLEPPEKGADPIAAPQLKVGKVPAGMPKAATTATATPDPEHVITVSDKQGVVKVVREVAEQIVSQKCEYAHLMRVMTDHQLIKLRQNDYALFGRALVLWLGDPVGSYKSVAESMRGRINRILRNQGLATGQQLPEYWLWDKDDEDRRICMQMADIFARNGFPRPVLTPRDAKK